MKKIIALVVIGFAIGANAQTINFTNACNYKISQEALNVDMRPASDESGDWLGTGSISFSLPTMPTNNIAGITLRPIHVVFKADCKIYVTAAEIAAKSGSNEVVKLNKVLRDKGRALGADLKAQLSQ